MEASLGERYNLKWHSHKTSLVTYLADHLTDEVLVDVILACEGKFIKAHKLILSACSIYFKELFELHNVEKPVIIMNNVKYEELKAVINFIYNGEIRVLDTDLQGVLNLGNNLKIKGLSSVAEKLFDKMEEIQNRSEESETNDKEEVKTKRKISPMKKVMQPNIFKRSQRNATNRKSVETTKNTDDQVSRPKRQKQCPKVEEGEIQLKSAQYIQPVTQPTVPTPIPQVVLGVVKIEQPTETEENPPEPPKTLEAGGIVPLRKTSAFMIFANEWRKRLAVEHPDETNKQISLRLSNMWKNLSDETRDTFYTAASKVNAEHKNLNKSNSTT